MFDYMTASQIASLIIGIVFSVISVATTIFAIKFAKKINSFGKSISLAIVCPTIAFIAWLFLIFSFIEGFRDDELLTLIIAIILSVIIDGVLFIVAKALYNKHLEEFEDEEVPEEPTNEENEESADVEVSKPLLLPNSEKEKSENEDNGVKQLNAPIIEEKEINENAETNVVSSDKSASQEESEDENIEKIDESVENDTENNDYNNVEENLVSAENNDNVEESVDANTNVEENVDDHEENLEEKQEGSNIEEQTENKGESVIENEESDSEEENIDETEKIESSDDIDYDDLTDDEKDDLEFEKFLEALRKRAQDNDNDETNDN